MIKSVSERQGIANVFSNKMASYILKVLPA